MLYRARSLKSGRGCRAPGFHPHPRRPQVSRAWRGAGAAQGTAPGSDEREGAFWEADLGGRPLPLPMSSERVGV